MGDYLLWDVFLITEEAQNFATLFPNGIFCIIIDYNRLGWFWGDFVTNSSCHSATYVHSSVSFRGDQIGRIFAQSGDCLFWAVA
jgi:hypothetical protein